MKNKDIINVMTIKEKIQKVVDIALAINRAKIRYFNEVLNKEEFEEKKDELYTEAEKYLK